MRPPRPPYTRIQLFLLLSAVCGTTLLLVLVYELVVPHHTQFATTAKWRKASQTSAASTTVADAANKPVQLTSMLGIQNATASCNDTPVCQLPVSWMLQRPYLHPIYKLNTSITTNTTTTTSSSSNQESSNNIRQSSSHLTGATDPAVALSRQQLQAYLASAEFTAYKLQLSENPAARLQQKHEQYLLPTHAPSRGILIVAGGRKLLTHLVVQLQVCQYQCQCQCLSVVTGWPCMLMCHWCACSLPSHIVVGVSSGLLISRGKPRNSKCYLLASACNVHQCWPSQSHLKQRRLFQIHQAHRWLHACTCLLYLGQLCALT
eukprot:GHRR01007970.1.p1 GENE.GHRR01007970.1~~GHRR01007970.1.p1  ORF type:complete len:319 (+),score=80.79 GHRR01007970.1:982-1938(+)